MECYFGCSGYAYKDWKGKFYPEDVPRDKWLSYYAETFKTVEINNTFYQLPKAETFKSWYDNTPDDFKFTIKGSRYVTHLKKLKDINQPMSEFYQGIDSLKGKTECILWQLPAKLRYNKEKLEAFCQQMSDEYNNVIEFRHPSWFVEEALDILQKYNVVYCIISAPDDLPESIHVTAQKAYVRFHGKTQWYDYEYGKDELDIWHHKLKSLHTDKLFVYFNNDVNGYAIDNCKYLMSLFDENG